MVAISEARRSTLLPILFAAGVGLLVALKLVLSSDLSVQVRYSPHDDSLYTERALHLLAGEGFGPYDSRVLVKYPGLSLWLWVTRSVGIPFLLSIHALYIASGLYLLIAFMKLGASRWVLLAALALYLFNPTTFSEDWLRVMREPLDTALLVGMVGAMAYVLVRLKDGPAWGHLAVFCIAFAFSMFVREENRLLWALLAIFFVALLWRAKAVATLDRRMIVFLVAALAAPAVLAKACEHALREFVESYYGLPIVHDFVEGEFPRLLAAIRSIESTKDNRMVMVTQDRLAKLEKQVPAFAPVVERLPKPGPATLSCRLHGVCSEWSNGWMPFWIKDEAYQAGLTPSLAAAQDYFQRVRTEIENACAAGRLRCSPNGDGFLPPMELRWTRAYVAEGYRLARMALAPELYPKVAIPVVEPSEKVRQMYQAMGMRPTDMTVSEPLARIRAALVAPHQILAAFLLIAALGALALRLWIADLVPLGPIALIGVIVGLYAILRLATLTYVAVYIGPFTSRIVFSIYAVSVLLALPFIVETISAWRTASTRG
jgi:hypothetical protein